jgi:hypothetical protein
MSPVGKTRSDNLTARHRVELVRVDESPSRWTRWKSCEDVRLKMSLGWTYARTVSLLQI